MFRGRGHAIRACGHTIGTWIGHEWKVTHGRVGWVLYVVGMVCLVIVLWNGVGLYV